MKTLFAMLAAVTMSGAAAAQSPAPKAPKASVAYVDLDLDSAEGRKALEHRIDRAVRRVCPAQPMPHEMLKSELWRSCIASARADADVQVAALYGGQILALNAITVTGKVR